MSVTRRRWFQFSLGAMLVLIALAALVMWELAFIHRRATVTASLRKNGAEVADRGWDTLNTYTQNRLKQPVSIPWWRRLAGDKAVQIITLRPGTPPSEAENVRMIFPEATIEIRPGAPSKEPFPKIDFGVAPPPTPAAAQ